MGGADPADGAGGAPPALLMLTRPAQERSFLLHWSRWRRRHQMRAKRCHYRRRGATFDG